MRSTRSESLLAAALAFLASVSCADRSPTSPSPTPDRPPPQARVVIGAPGAGAAADAREETGPLVPGAWLQLDAAMDHLPDGAPQPEITWTSSDRSVVRVSMTGFVEAVGPGEAEVIADALGDTSRVVVVVRHGGLIYRDRSSVTEFGGLLSLSTPEGAVPKLTHLAVDSLDAASLGASAVAGTAFRLGPAGLAFAHPAMLVVRYDPALLPPDTWAPRLRLMEVSGGSVLPLNASEADTAEHFVRAHVSGAGTYAIVPDVAVSRVDVSPAAVSVARGIAQTFEARPFAADGVVIPGRRARWASSNETVARIDEEGIVIAQAPGEATITATVDGRAGTAHLRVTTPGPLQLEAAMRDADPGTSFGISVYDGRWAPLDASTLHWESSAPEVVAITAPGLVTSVAAGFARITVTSADGVQGSVTVTVGGIPVEAVTLDLSVVRTLVGGKSCPRATAWNEVHNPIPGVPLSWSSSNEGVAIVAADGVVRAVGAGSAAITARVGGRSATMQLEVSPAPPVPAGATYSNEPAGLTPVSDNHWNEIGTECWQHADRAAASRIVEDATAPRSPGSVLEHPYPVGFPGGQEPSIEQFLFRPRLREAFVGTFVKFSEGWQGHSGGVNKLVNLVTADQGQRLWLVLRAVGERDDNNDLSDGPYVVDGVFCNDYGGLPGTNRSSEPVTVGEWHKLEWYVRTNTPGQSDGIVRWWVDGVLRGEYTGLGCVGNGLDWLEVAPTFGGVQNTKQHDDYLRFDQVYISGRP